MDNSLCGGFAAGGFVLVDSVLGVSFIVAFIYMGARDIAYRKAEKRCPGIYARMQRYVDARLARLAAERKAKAERRKRANELADKRLLRWLDEHPGVVGGAGHSLSS